MLWILKRLLDKLAKMTTQARMTLFMILLSHLWLIFRTILSIKRWEVHVLGLIHRISLLSQTKIAKTYFSYLEIHLFRSGDIILRNSDHLSPQLIFRGGIWADHDGNSISNLKLPRGFSIVTETIAQPNMFEIRCDGQLLCSGIVRGAESRKILRGSFFPDRNTGAIGVQYNETSGFWRGIGRRQDIYFEPVHYPTLKMTCQELSSEVLHKTTVFGTETESQLEEDDIGYVEHIEGFSEKFSQLIKDYSRNYFDFQPFDSTSSSSPSDSSRSRVDVSGFSSDKVETSILSPPKLERRNTFKPTSQSDSSSSSSPYYSTGSTIYVSDCASDKVIRLPKLKRRNTVTLPLGAAELEVVYSSDEWTSSESSKYEQFDATKKITRRASLPIIPTNIGDVYSLSSSPDVSDILEETDSSTRSKSPTSEPKSDSSCSELDKLEVPSSNGHETRMSMYTVASHVTATSINYPSPGQIESGSDVNLAKIKDASNTLYRNRPSSSEQDNSERPRHVRRNSINIGRFLLTSSESYTESTSDSESESSSPEHTRTPPSDSPDPQYTPAHTPKVDDTPVSANNSPKFHPLDSGSPTSQSPKLKRAHTTGRFETPANSPAALSHFKRRANSHNVKHQYSSSDFTNRFFEEQNDFFTKLDKSTNFDLKRAHTSDRFETPANSPTVNSRFETPVKSPTVNSRFETPVNSPTVNSRFETPVNSRTVNSRFETPVNSPTVNSLYETLVNSPTVNSSFETPVNSRTVNSRFETPVNSPTVNSLYETLVNSPTVNSSFETPVNSRTVNSRFETPVNLQKMKPANPASGVTKTVLPRTKHVESLSRFSTPYNSPKASTTSTASQRTSRSTIQTNSREICPSKLTYDKSSTRFSNPKNSPQLSSTMNRPINYFPVQTNSPQIVKSEAIMTLDKSSRRFSTPHNSPKLPISPPNKFMRPTNAPEFGKPKSRLCHYSADDGDLITADMALGLLDRLYSDGNHISSHHVLNNLYTYISD
eukprot:482259_1